MDEQLRNRIESLEMQMNQLAYENAELRKILNSVYDYYENIAPVVRRIDSLRREMKDEVSRRYEYEKYINDKNRTQAEHMMRQAEQERRAKAALMAEQSRTSRIRKQQIEDWIDDLLK